MMKTHLAKWGNSLAVRIPKDLAEDALWRAGDLIELVVHKPGCVLVRALRPQPTIRHLVAGITPKNRHREIKTGKPVGNEVW
ncbi:MAG: chpR [Candidatus Angelobacter sp.]|jgi:antitoxin MazE|nr:chpR [Candidatus Angelobacter sp.]